MNGYHTTSEQHLFFSRITEGKGEISRNLAQFHNHIADEKLIDDGNF
jgi:hypothetical protein